MKIMYILRAGYGAGGGAASFQYASILSKKHDIVVLESVNPKSIEKKVSYDDNVKVIDVYASKTIEQIMNVYDAIKNFNPDIIHMIQSPYALHYMYFLKHLFQPSKWVIDFRSPHVGEEKSPAIKRYFFLQFYADIVLTHSMESLKTNLPWKLVKAKEIPPGIDMSMFKLNKRKTIKKPKRFIFIGSISKSRKLDFLISTFGDYVENRDLDVTLDIFGDGNDYVELQKLIQDKGLENCIHLMGALPQEELFQVISDYDVGIAYVPYEFFNTAPSLKSLEYAAAKVSIIASDTLGHQEYNEKHGFDFNLFSNTVEGFTSILEKITNSENLSTHIDKNYDAVKSFDWEFVVEKKLHDIYKKL